MRSNSAPFLVATAAMIALSACNSDDVTAPPDPQAGEFTVDARSNWVYISLVDSAIVTPTPSASASADWDIAFFATNTMLNGGQAGPGGVSGHCLCQNAGATDAAVLAMTAESEFAYYQNTTVAASSLLWTSEQLQPAIRDWFTGTGAAAVADPAAVFVVRLSDGTSYAKLRVSSIQNASATTAGSVTLQYAVQPTGGNAFGTMQTLVVDAATGAKNIDLNTGAVTASATDWDIRIDGFTIRVNGGASGSGSAAAYLSPTGFDQTPAAVAPPAAYSADSFTGVFGNDPWFRYNILGDNRVSPVFNVYLIRRGSTIWKLQVLSYYNATVTPRYITFRYERIAG